MNICSPDTYTAAWRNSALKAEAMPLAATARPFMFLAAAPTAPPVLPLALPVAPAFMFFGDPATKIAPRSEASVQNTLPGSVLPGGLLPGSTLARWLTQSLLVLGSFLLLCLFAAKGEAKNMSGQTVAPAAVLLQKAEKKPSVMFAAAPGLSTNIPASASPKVSGSPSANKPGANKTGKAKGFSDDPFALGRADDGAQKATVIYGPGGAVTKNLKTDGKGKKKSGAAATAPGKAVKGTASSAPKEGEQRFSVRAGASEKSDDRLVPQHKTFSGGKQTLSAFDEKEAPPEVDMSYKVTDSAVTRVVVNPQNENSPLYRPADPSGVQSAGVYMDVAVKPDVSVQLGGEYCEVESPTSQPDAKSKGASVGLKWQF